MKKGLFVLSLLVLAFCSFILSVLFNEYYEQIMSPVRSIVPDGSYAVLQRINPVVSFALVLIIDSRYLPIFLFTLLTSILIKKYFFAQERMPLAFVLTYALLLALSFAGSWYYSWRELYTAEFYGVISWVVTCIAFSVAWFCNVVTIFFADYALRQ